MKKLVVAILAVLYMVSASGIVMDHEVAAGEKKTKWVKLKDSHHVKLPKQVKHFTDDSNLPRAIETASLVPSPHHYTHHFIASTNKQVTPIYLHNCVLRI